MARNKRAGAIIGLNANKVSVVFRNRAEAGSLLAQKLAAFANRRDVLVLALPRGGVPVAFEIAQALRAPLDVLTVRKLGVPGSEELAMGAIATGGIRILNTDLISALGIPKATIEAVTTTEQSELERRERLYRRDRPLPAVRGRSVILVDDGLATGATMSAAVEALRQLDPARIVVAVPIASESVCEWFRTKVTEIICAATVEHLDGIGLWYEDFAQVSDQEVADLLRRATQRADAQQDE